ncbi:hypothetical protein D3C74_52030 [compost metagenome]
MERNDPAAHQAADDSCTEREKAVLMECFRVFAGQPMNEQDPLLCMKGRLSGAETRAAIVGLRRKGWLKAVVKTWGERLLYIPAERLEMLYAAMLHREGTAIRQTVKPEMVIAEATEAVIYRLLHVLARMTPAGVPLTSKGTVHKRVLGKLAEMSPFKPDGLQGLGLQYAHQEIYPVHTAVLLDVLLSLGLLDKKTGAYELDERRLASWLRLTLGEAQKQLMTVVMERYGAADAVMQHVRQLLQADGFTDGQWYAWSPLETWMSQSGIHHMEADALTHKAKQWMLALAEFGFMDVGVAVGGALVFRWCNTIGHRHEETSSVGSDQGSFFIQPDFEVLVPPEVGLHTRWRLECCAEPVSYGVMCVYRLSRERIAEAIEGGMTSSGLMLFLQKYSTTDLPQNVELAVEQWTATVARTSLEAVTLLRCQSLDDAERAAADPELSGIMHRLGELDFIVPGGEQERVRSRLANIGLAPRRALQGGDTPAQQIPLLAELENDGYGAVTHELETDKTQAHQVKVHEVKTHEAKAHEAEAAAFSPGSRSGLVYTGRTLHYYEADSILPELERDYAGLDAVPVSWYKEWRSYHASTARALLEQAIRWDCAVGLETTTGKQEWLPEAITGGSDWRVTGMFRTDDSSEQLPYSGLPGSEERAMSAKTSTPAVLSPEDWKEMKLLLPL